MARKIQQLSIDGIGVEMSKARFGDTFDVADGDERLLAFDEEVVYVVVARVSTPSFRESKSGEVSRVNVLKVKEARLVKDEASKVALLDKTKFDYRPQPSMFDTDETESDEGPEDLSELGVKLNENTDPGPQITFNDEVAELIEESVERSGFTTEGGELADEDTSGPEFDVDPEDFERDEHDEDMRRFLELTKGIADEYDIPTDEVEDLGPPVVETSTSRGTRKFDARGAEKADPILANFMRA